ncbi:MAG: APC family permease, partial [Elusimicrobia bacterium]|nr:APC family permease [Elusimicrobiota bacterium]
MTVKPAARLRLMDVLALGLNAIVGSGIFLFPGTLAALVGPASVLVFLVTALLLASVALCYAELGGMFGGSGGSYLYAREAFGDRVGYGVGVLAWTAAVVSWAAVASLLAGHLAWFDPFFARPWAARASAAGVLLLFGVLNDRGLRPAAWTVDGLTLAKLVPLAVFVLLCLPRAAPARFSPFFGGQHRFAYAVFLALWALQGFEVAPVPAGEAEDPQRDVPRAVLGSLAVAAVLYALVQAAAVGVHPGLAASGETPLIDAAQAALGPWGGASLGGGRDALDAGLPRRGGLGRAALPGGARRAALPPLAPGRDAPRDRRAPPRHRRHHGSGGPFGARPSVDEPGGPLEPGRHHAVPGLRRGRRG